MFEHVLAFDLGGSHVSATLAFDGLQPIVANPIAADASAAEILKAIDTAGRQALAAANQDARCLSGIAMAAPGPFDYEKGISLMQHKHASLYEVSIRQYLADQFHVKSCDVAFLHDARAFLLGEITRTRRGNAERVVGITLGTGLGSAFYSHGELLVKGAGVPTLGEIYNLPWEGRTVEDILSTRYLVEAYRTLSGETISVRAIAERAATDGHAREVLESFGTNLGRVLNATLREFKPHLIVLGGGITGSSELFLPCLLRQLTKVAPDVHVCDKLDEAPLLGAAQFWRSQHGLRHQVSDFHRWKPRCAGTGEASADLVLR